MEAVENLVEKLDTNLMFFSQDFFLKIYFEGKVTSYIKVL